MGRPCRVCVHDQRSELERRLREGMPHAAAARLFGVSRWSVDGHVRDHMAEAMERWRQEREAAETAAIGEYVDQVQQLVDEVRGILAASKADGKPHLSLQAAGRLTEALRLLGQASGKLRSDAATVNVGVQVNVLESPQWRELAGRIMAALERHPEARRDVAEAIGYPELPRPEVAILPYREPDELEAEAIDGEAVELLDDPQRAADSKAEGSDDG